jgi:hypothetical protein
VADELCILDALRVQSLDELLRERVDAEPPVERVKLRVEACDLQRQLELERIEQHHAQRRELRAARQRQPHETSRSDFDDIHPEHVVEESAVRADP